MPARYLHRNNFQRKDFVWHQWSRTLGQRIHHPGNGASSGAVRLLSGFSRLENSARKGDGRDGGSLRFLNPCCDQVLFAVAVPCIWDRLIQQCIKQVIEPICEAKFSDNSYGFRPNRSVEHAIQRTYTMLQRMNLHYVIEFDIKGFFDNVNHSKLVRQIWALGIHDKQLIFIIKRILKAPIKMPDGSTVIPDRGTPQGNLCGAPHNPPCPDPSPVSSYW